MLTVINALQLVLYVAGLALLGQGLLYLLAGQKRNTNFAYQLFQVLTKPAFLVARFIAPRQIADSQTGFVAFFVVVILYAAVTLWKIEYCVGVQMVGCRSA
jgi:hypothetical protein